MQGRKNCLLKKAGIRFIGLQKREQKSRRRDLAVRRFHVIF